MQCDVRTSCTSSMTAVFNTVLYKKNPRCAYCSRVLLPTKFASTREHRFTREHIVPLSVAETIEAVEKITAITLSTPQEFRPAGKFRPYQVLNVRVNSRRASKLEEMGISKEYYNFLVDIYRFLPLIDSPANVIQCCQECNASRGNSFEFIRNNPLELNPFHYQLILAEFANRPQTRNPQSPRFGQVITLEFYETLARHNFLSGRDKFILRWIRSLVDKELRYHQPPLGNATTSPDSPAQSSNLTQPSKSSNPAKSGRAWKSSQPLGNATSQGSDSSQSSNPAIFHTFSMAEVLDLVSDGYGLWCTDVVGESSSVLPGLDVKEPFGVGLSDYEVSFFHRKAVLNGYGELVNAVVYGSAPPLHCDSWVTRRYAERKGTSSPVFNTHLSGIVQLNVRSA